MTWSNVFHFHAIETYFNGTNLPLKKIPHVWLPHAKATFY